MSDSSKLFDEFIITKCEEVLEGDEGCANLNKELAEVENAMKKELDSRQYKLFIQHESLTTELQSRAVILAYKNGLDDRLKRTGV